MFQFLSRNRDFRRAAPTTKIWTQRITSLSQLNNPRAPGTSCVPRSLRRDCFLINSNKKWEKRKKSCQRDLMLSWPCPAHPPPPFPSIPLTTHLHRNWYAAKLPPKRNPFQDSPPESYVKNSCSSSFKPRRFPKAGKLPHLFALVQTHIRIK